MRTDYSAATTAALLWLITLAPMAWAASDSAFSPPRGYMERIEIEIGDQLYSFGPFVGYYFKPLEPGSLERLHFVCYNEGSFYSSDAGAGSLIFKGQARLRSLPLSSAEIPIAESRIVPLFFEEVPVQWLATRPEPRDEFVHFHSLYNARGAAAHGYWLKHEAQQSFTYDMGGRVGPASPLYHEVKPGTDLAFARIVEFDHGPDSTW